jgi:disulfide oxidoreductase YuzD
MSYNAALLLCKAAFLLRRLNVFDSEKKRNSGTVDMSEKARENDIAIPVILTESLVNKLNPNHYLTELGISFNKRLVNLFELVRANLEPADAKKMKEKSFTVPLIVVSGPLVSEDVISTVVRIQKNDKGEQYIFISDLQETNNGFDD